ncbi:NAD(P)-binding domain-containing protein [Phyllobacterium sp. SB3]|uniref:NAD(P)-binding domain-containing protein n=1 Tax=Phyllobacterium sp. SB3 TaxID=3156073 RepID=UPI0032AFCC12
MSSISIIGSGGMAAAIGGLAVRAGHTVEVMARDAAKARGLAEQIGPGASTGIFGAAPTGDLRWIVSDPVRYVVDHAAGSHRKLRSRFISRT